MRPRIFAVVLSCFASTYSANDQNVKMRQSRENVHVSIDGSPFVTYCTAGHRSKPSFTEIRSAEGTLITRPLAAPGEKDSHHHALWISLDDVSGVDFWHEEGRILTKSVTLHPAINGTARLELSNEWIDSDSQPVVHEQTLVSFYPNRLMIFDISLTAADEPVTYVNKRADRSQYELLVVTRDHGIVSIQNARRDWKRYANDLPAGTCRSHPQNE